MILALLALQLAAETIDLSTDNFGKPFASNVPNDVRLFVIDLQACNHFASEPRGSEPERDRFLTEQTEKHCARIEERQKQLLERYPGRPDLRALILDE